MCARARVRERERQTCTQHVEPVCIASQRVTFVQGLIIALPSGVTTLLPDGLFRLDKLQRETQREREEERGTRPAAAQVELSLALALSQWEGRTHETDWPVGVRKEQLPGIWPSTRGEFRATTATASRGTIIKKGGDDGCSRRLTN